MIRSDLPRRHGRKPGVRFPIVRTVVEGGLDREKTLNAGDKLTCLRCGMAFEADSTCVRLGELEIDDMPYVHCVFCGYTAPVLQYFAQAEKSRPRRMRTPEDYAVRIITPERRDE